MVANQEELELSDGSTTYNFTLAPNNSGGKLIDITSRQWEPGDIQQRWRVPLHHVDAGLAPDKITNKRGYAKAQADCSNLGTIVPPPYQYLVPATSLSVTHRAATSATAASGANLVINAPAGLADGDFMILTIYCPTPTAIINPPTGWTFLARYMDTDGTNGGIVEVYYKIASAEGANYTVLDNSATRNAVIAAFISVDHFFPVTEVRGTGSSGAAVISPTIHSRNANTQVIAIQAARDGTWATPAGYTERVDANGLAIAEATQPTIANVNYTPTWTAGTAGTVKWSIILCLRPIQPTRRVLFKGREYFGIGRYLYYITGNFTGAKTVSVTGSPTALVQLKDFGAGTYVYDLEVFNGELIIAMGETVKIWKMADTHVFTQATDNTYAIALGVVDNKLWRAETTNKLSNCITTPLTLTNWVPASANQYTVGESNFRVIDILDYGGIPYVIKNDGVYAPDAKAEFHNQAPQMTEWPDRENGFGSFVANGYLWCPTASGLLRISTGESIPVGPELSERPNFVFRVRAGTEYNGNIYLLCSDLSAVSSSIVCKAQPDKGTYHEYIRLTNSDYFTIGVNSLSDTPQLSYSLDSAVYQVKLGRPGKYIDDPLYLFDVINQVEFGNMAPIDDLSVVSQLIGVKIVYKHVSASDTLVIAHDVDETGTFTNLLDTQEGSGSANLTGVTGWNTGYRYAATTIAGRLINIRVTQTPTSTGAGTSRCEIREVFAFGFSRPEQTHIITVGIYSDKNARVFGLKQGRNAGENLRQFTDWMNEGTVLTMLLSDYEDARTLRCRITGVKQSSENVHLGSGRQVENVNILFVSLERIDFANAFAD